MTHTGNAMQGGTLAYTVTPSVSGSATTTATLTASFTLPTGMTYTSASGNGWSCSGSGQSGSCTTTTGFAVGNGPAITLNTAFATTATSPLVPSVQLSGGGAANASSATDSTVVTQVPTAVAPTTGNNQSAAVGTAFAAALSVTVRDANGAVVPNTQVTFMAPASGASGTFSNASNTITVNTNGSGVASAGTFTANATAGGPFTVSATAGAASSSFALTNTAAATNVTLSSGTNPSTYGNDVVFTVRVTDPNGGGSVQLRDGGSNVGPATVVAAGTDQTITVSGLGVATHSITASYTPTSPETARPPPRHCGQSGGQPGQSDDHVWRDRERIAVGLAVDAERDQLGESGGDVQFGHECGVHGERDQPDPGRYRYVYRECRSGGRCELRCGARVTRSFTVTPAALVVTPGAASGTAVGGSYSQANPASGGTAPYTYSLASGAVPNGTNLDTASGTVTGTPTTAGAFSYAVQATDSQAPQVTVTGATVNVTIAKAAQTITFAPLNDASLSASPLTLSATSSAGLAVTFGSATTAVCTTAGDSLTLIATGTCSVNADQAGDANYAAATQVQRSFTVTPATLAASQAQGSVSGTVGIALTPVIPVTASGGTTPYSYVLTGVLPAGLSFSASTGALSGTPTGGQAATAYTVTVNDAGGQSASAGFTLTVGAATIDVTPATLPDAAKNVAYSQALAASGGTAPYTYAVTAGALPTGLTLSSAGVVSGTPTTTGNFSFTVTATDRSTGTGAYSGDKSYRIAVTAPTLTLAPATLADAAIGVGYTATGKHERRQRAL